MKWAKVLMLMFFLAASWASGTALARDRHHGGHVHGSVGIYFGPGPLWPWYGYPPRYYYPPYPPYQPMVVVPSTPPVYIERSDVPPVVTVQPPAVTQVPVAPPAVQAPVAPPVQAPAPAADAYWYYCADPQGYYPYVKSCPLGWQKVAPSVPPQ